MHINGASRCGGWLRLHRQWNWEWKQVFTTLVTMEFGVVKGD